MEVKKEIQRNSILNFIERLNMENRRVFLQKIGLTGIVAAGFPGMMAQAAFSKADRIMNLRNGMVFLFQGDSITDGNRGRNSDPNHIMGHGYAFSIASRLGADHPEKGLVFYNRGISGNKVSDLAARWQTDTLDLKPDVLSILVGVNDVGALIRSGSFEQPDHFEETYRQILDQAQKQFPSVLLVLCEPFTLPVGKVKEKWDVWEREIKKRREIVRNLANAYDAVFVEFQDVINQACRKAPAEYWIWDGVHPTVPCHELLAREWIRQVGKRIRF